MATIRTIYTLDVETAVQRASEKAAADFLNGCTDWVVAQIHKDAIERGRPLIAEQAKVCLQNRGVKSSYYVHENGGI